MNKFFEFSAKLAIVILSIIGLFVVLGLMLDGDLYTDSYRSNQRYVASWLHDLEAVEDKDFAASTFRDICNSKNQSDKAYCNGYMLGFIEGNSMSAMTPFCGSDSLRSSKQSIQAFENFMEDNPQHWEKSRDAILGAALQKAFPCYDPNSP